MPQHPSQQPSSRIVADVRAWSQRRTFQGSRFSLDDLLARKKCTISVVLPARNVASTVGDVVRTIMQLKHAGLIDELLVIDAGSTDATAKKVRECGIEAVPETELLPDFGESLGKGDALWRGLASTGGDIVAFFDTDTQNFGRHFVLGLLGPLLHDESLHLVKAAFHRPLQLGGAKVEDEGGRVTELVARPLINIYFPALAGFIQPLAGEVAARRPLLESMPIPGGYGAEIGMLIDALGTVGSGGLAQSDIGRREDANQPLRNLSSMAYAVAAATLARAGNRLPSDDGLILAWPEGIEVRDIDVTERPPVASLARARI